MRWIKEISEDGKLFRYFLFRSYPVSSRCSPHRHSQRRVSVLMSLSWEIIRDFLLVDHVSSSSIFCWYRSIYDLGTFPRGCSVRIFWKWREGALCWVAQSPSWDLSYFASEKDRCRNTSGWNIEFYKLIYQNVSSRNNYNNSIVYSATISLSLVSLNDYFSESRVCWWENSFRDNLKGNDLLTYTKLLMKSTIENRPANLLGCSSSKYRIGIGCFGTKV